MRNIVDVIEQLREASSKDEFKHELNSIEDSYYYTAPELVGLLWNRLHDNILSEYVVGHEDNIEDEGVTILSIFTTKSEEEVREMFE